MNRHTRAKGTQQGVVPEMVERQSAYAEALDQLYRDLKAWQHLSGGHMPDENDPVERQLELVLASRAPGRERIVVRLLALCSESWEGQQGSHAYNYN